MTATRMAHSNDTGEQSLTLQEISWSSYLAISEPLSERPDVRLIFRDGSLTFSTTSRKHDWYAERLESPVMAVADCFDIAREDSGSATYRREEHRAGAEGDKVFYVGEHAELMAGPVNIDLATQPPPDLAIEVEISHSADAVMRIWGRLGVPEIWRFDPESWGLSVWHLRANGESESAARSLAFPVVEAQDILSRPRLSEDVVASRWTGQPSVWVRGTLLPRLGGPPADGQ